MEFWHPLLAAPRDPQPWFITHIREVVFAGFMVIAFLSHIAKKAEAAARERRRKDPHDSGAERASSTTVEAGRPAAEDLESRVRRYFEQLTGERGGAAPPAPAPAREAASDPLAVELASEPGARAAVAPPRWDTVNPTTGGPVVVTYADATQGEMRTQLGDVAPAVVLTRRRAARPAATEARGTLLQDLTGADALRRAIVLREVLGPPRALRELGEPGET